MFRIIIITFLSINIFASPKTCDKIVETWTKAYTLNVVKIDTYNLIERIPKALLNTLNIDNLFLSISDYTYLENLILAELFSEENISKYVKNDCSFVYAFIQQIIDSRKEQYLNQIKLQLKKTEKPIKRKSLDKFKKILSREEIDQEIQDLVYNKSYKKSEIQKNDFLDLQENLINEHFSDLDYIISNAILMSFDPHSRQLTKKEQKSLMEDVQGKPKMRFGYETSKNNDGTFTFKNSHESFIVKKINGIDSIGLTSYSLMKLMDVQSVLDLTIKEKIKTIYKKEDKEETIKHKRINKSLYISFDSFYTNNNDKSLSLEVYNLLEKNKDIDSIILDLRNNGGGSFLESIYLSSLFLELEQEIITIKESSSTFLNDFEIKNNIVSLFFKKPIIAFNKFCLDDNFNLIKDEWFFSHGEIHTTSPFTCYFNQKQNNSITMNYKIRYNNDDTFKEEQGEEITTFQKRNNPLIPEKYVNKKPIIILTSRFTASSSEILITAMKDHSRALVIGDDSTFGKATMQSYLGDSAITTGKIFSPRGYTYQGIGFKPDIELLSSRNFTNISESELLYNIENVNKVDESVNRNDDIQQLYMRFVKKHPILEEKEFDRELFKKQDLINFKFIKDNINLLTKKAKAINN